MGETLKDIEAREAAHARAPALAVRHAGGGEPRRAKIEIRDLDFFYGAAQALKGIRLDVPEHQITCLIGPSGCGKSTLLRVLNRIYSMYRGQRALGTVLLDGQDVLGPDVDLRRLRSRVGMVFQTITAFPMSIYGNVAFGPRTHENLTRAELDLRVEEALTRAALWKEVKDRLRDPADDLSGGQQQRLCIARALSTRPEVLLLDEPTSALDPLSMMKIENLMDELRPHVTVALVTHNLQQAARCADKVVFFYLGELIEAGTASQMFTAPRHAQTRRYIGGRFG